MDTVSPFVPGRMRMSSPGLSVLLSILMFLVDCRPAHSPFSRMLKAPVNLPFQSDTALSRPLEYVAHCANASFWRQQAATPAPRISSGRISCALP